MVGQLQWLVTLVCLVKHAQVMTMSILRSTPRQLQVISGNIKKTIISNWIQSNHYLSDMLSKHWDLLKTLPMITSLLMNCDPTILFRRSALMETSMLSIYRVIYPHHTLKISGIYTHTHTQIILHISTYGTCQHKSMPHPPQEGSNRILAYCTLLGVLW